MDNKQIILMLLMKQELLLKPISRLCNILDNAHVEYDRDSLCTTFLKAVVGADVDAILDYQTYADPVKTVDTWRGKFISDPFEFETTGRHGTPCIEISTITLQFRGTKQ